MRLFQLLGEELFLSQMHLLAPEVLNAETHAPQLDRVKLVYLVVEFALGVLERPDNQPQSIDGLLLGLQVAVLDVESVCSCYKEATYCYPT